MELTELDVDMIVTIDRKRPVNDSNVQYLADSIKRVGLQTPITVRIVSKMDDPVTGKLRIPINPARYSDRNPATRSDPFPATCTDLISAKRGCLPSRSVATVS